MPYTIGGCIVAARPVDTHSFLNDSIEFVLINNHILFNQFDADDLLWELGFVGGLGDDISEELEARRDMIGHIHIQTVVGQLWISGLGVFRLQ